MPRSLEEIRALAKSGKPAAAAGTPAAMKMPTLQKGHTPANASGRCAVIQILAPHTHPNSKVGWRPLSVLFKCNLHLNRTQTQWSPHAYSAQADIVSAHTHAFTTPHKRICFQKHTYSLTVSRAAHFSLVHLCIFVRVRLGVCVMVYACVCVHVGRTSGRDTPLQVSKTPVQVHVCLRISVCLSARARACARVHV